MELVIGHIVLKCCDGTGGIAFKFWYEKNLIGNVYSSLNESYVMWIWISWDSITDIEH